MSRLEPAPEPVHTALWAGDPPLSYTLIRVSICRQPDNFVCSTALFEFIAYGDIKASPMYKIHLSSHA